MTTPNRERTYEAIYAAAYIRFRCDECDPPAKAHVDAEIVAKEWLEMVQAAEGEQG